MLNASLCSVERTRRRRALGWNIIFAVFFPLSAWAQVDWIDKAASCEEFSQGLSAFFARTSALSELSPRDEEETVKILRSACGEKFAKCHFAICDNLDLGAGDQELKRKAVIITDPLGWLNEELSCEQFIDQVKARYSPLGKYSALPEEKKNEIRHVLDVTCSPRFAHCRFKQCDYKSGRLSGEDGNADEKSGSAEGDIHPNPTFEVQAVDEFSVARKRLVALVKDAHAVQEKAIYEKIEQERRDKLEWAKMTIGDGFSRTRRGSRSAEARSASKAGSNSGQGAEDADLEDEEDPAAGEEDVEEEAQVPKAPAQRGISAEDQIKIRKHLEEAFKKAGAPPTDEPLKKAMENLKPGPKGDGVRKLKMEPSPFLD